MRTHVRGFVLAVLFATHAVAASLPTDAEIRKILADRIDTQKRSVGMVVGVITPEGRRVISYGVGDQTSKRPVNGDTIFEIGSVTKVFTSLLLADAVQRGEVALTDPVAKYLPSTVKVPERGGKKITLQDLAMHVSALPRLPTNLAPKDPTNPYADYTVQQLYDFLGSYELPRDIGTEYEYSNLGAGLLGHVLALRAGVPYETLVRTRILAPLQMKSTAITLTDAMQKRLAAGHDTQLAHVPNWDLPTVAGAGALRSTANDMLNFLAANLRMTTTTLSPAISTMLAQRRSTERPGTSVALAWHITTRADGSEFVWHNGGTGGYRSFIGFDPKQRTGVVVLSNTSTQEGGDDIGRHLLDPTLPLFQAPKEITVAPEILESYTGIYELAPQFALVITREGNRLFSQATGQQRVELFPQSDTKFFFKVVDAQITFEKDGLTLHQAGNHFAKRVQASAAAPKKRTAITIDPKIYDRYTGRYQLTPAFVIAITREGDRLFLQATAQPKFEIFPESERDFFLEAVDAQITFVPDLAGRVTKLILHQNGANQEAARVE